MARVISNIDYSFNAVAMEGVLSELDQNITNPPADITSFSDAWQNFLAGDKKNVVTSIRGHANQTASEAERLIFAAIGGGPVTTLFDITGSGPAANDPEYQCTASGLTGALVSSMELDLPVGDKGSFSATIQHSGSTTRAVA